MRPLQQDLSKSSPLLKTILSIRYYRTMTRKKDLLVEEPTDEMLSSIEANLEQELSGEATSEDNSDEINYPKTGETYNHKDKLTLDIDGQPVTRKLILT